MTTTNLTLYGKNSRQIKPAVVNLFQANNNVDRLEFQMENYNQDNVDLSTLDPYVICHGKEFIGGLDEVKLTSEVTEDGLLRVYWDLTIMQLADAQTITYQLVFKNAEGAVWTSYKGILFCNESLTADEEIVAQYPTILKQMEQRIDTKTDEAIDGVVEEIVSGVSDEVSNAVTQINQIAGNFDASVVYIPFGEKIPVENRVSNRLYYQYMDVNHTKGRFEDSEGTILIVDESGAATYAPIGAIIPVNATSNYVPDGCLPCNGAEYSNAMFKDLWNNWLTSEDFTVIEEGWGIPVTVGTNTLRSVIYVNNKYYMLGSNYDVLMSNDGITWDESVTVGDKFWNCITYGNGRFVIVNSYGYISYSDDGVNWSEPITIEDRGWSSVTYGNDKFVAVGLSGYVITSVDGVNWGTPIQVGTALWNYVTYGNGRFVATGDYTVATSTDGVNWNEPVSVEGKYYYSVCYGNGKFVAVGSSGAIITSEDGVNWTKQAVVGDSVSWMSVTYAKDKFVAVGTKGNISTSVDGVTWTEPIAVGDNAWTSVTCSDDKLVAVGYSGAIAYNVFEIKYATRLNVCSYIEYLEDLAAYGQCSKFAVDVDNGLFKVPTVNDSGSELIHFVVVSNGQIDESMFDWSEWYSSLNHKADKATTLEGYGITDGLNKSQITNCITEIPQRIKYELVDGNLTVKAGSVVIVPYGTEDLTAQYPVGATFINDNFKVYDTEYTEDGQFFVWVELQNDISKNGVGSSTVVDMTVSINFDNVNLSIFQNEGSGVDTPSTSSNLVYYKTDINVVQYYLIGNLTDYVHSLPLLRVKNDANQLFATVTQVFNGMGYIGSTVWCDKGVKVLIPNGRNEDGTLKNIEFTTDKLLSSTTSGVNHSGMYITISSKGSFMFHSKTTSIGDRYYDWNKNLVMNTGNDPRAILGEFQTDANKNIINYDSKLAFHAPDIQDVVRKTGDKMTGDLELYGTSSHLGLFGGSIFTHNMDISMDTAPSSNIYFPVVEHQDKNNTRKSRVESFYKTDGSHGIQLSEKHGSSYSAVTAGFDADGNAYTYAPHCNITNGIVTQAGIKKATSGYLKFGNGIIIQWGYTTVSSKVATVTFPVAFTSQRQVTLTPVSSTTGRDDNATITSISNTNFKIYCEDPCCWIAMGY